MKFVLRLAVFWLALSGLALSGPAVAAELVFPPGSRIGLVPAPGLTAAAHFQGFEGRRGATVAITELAGQGYTRLAREFTPESIRAAGMELVSREELALPGGPAVIVSARNQVSGVTMRQWALSALFGDISIIVMMTMPEDARDVYPDAVVRAMFDSVSVRPPLAEAELLAVLPYRLTDLGGFHLMRATPDGTATLTFGPYDTPLPVEQPYFMVAAHGLNPSPAEYENFARRAFARVGGVGSRIVSAEAMRIGGAPGYQIVAESKDERTGDELVIVQWMRFGPGYVQMVGYARKDKWDEVFPRMRALRDGFAVK